MPLHCLWKVIKKGGDAGEYRRAFDLSDRIQVEEPDS